MNECFRCGVSGEKVRLNKAISNKGIVDVCDDCASIERIPIIKKPTEEQILEAQRPRLMKDRLLNVNSRGKVIGKEVTLRELVDRDFKSKKIQPHPDLIDNFHWTIQRIKRTRRITREQLAKAIGESDANMRMIEQGFLPENDYKIINKIESYLGISLRKPGTSGFPSATNIPKRFSLDNSLTEKKEDEPKRLSFDKDSTKQLKISDLKDIKKKQEQTKQPIDSWEDEYSQDDELFLDEPEEFYEEED
ncbi:hypothetical protein M0R19_01000 [Candidatus Pacearchaeota archaeon]|nr:hypothetical protein [Candidatus Pacearchaeota archaeon]